MLRFGQLLSQSRTQITQAASHIAPGVILRQRVYSPNIFLPITQQMNKTFHGHRRMFVNACRKELLKTYRKAARDKSSVRGRGVFEGIARSIRVEFHETHFRITSNHRAAHFKLTGGTVYPHRAKAIAVPVAKFLDGRGRTSPRSYGGQLEFHRPAGSGNPMNRSKTAQPRKASRESDFIGTLFDKRKARTIFALYRKMHFRRDPWIPSQQKVYEAFDRAATKVNKRLSYVS